MLCNPLCGRFILNRFCPQLLDKVPGVDSDGAGCCAESVRGAGVDAGVGEILCQHFAQGSHLADGRFDFVARGATPLSVNGRLIKFKSRNFSLHNDPLARGQR